MSTLYFCDTLFRFIVSMLFMLSLKHFQSCKCMCPTLLILNPVLSSQCCVSLQTDYIFCVINVFLILIHIHVSLLFKLSTLHFASPQTSVLPNHYVSLCTQSTAAHCPRPVGTPYYVFAPDCPITVSLIFKNSTSKRK